MDTVLIREMTQNDRIGVSEIYTYAIEEGGSTFTYRCPSYSQWDEEHHKDCRYVAEIDGNVTGWCALSPTSPKEAYSGVAEVSIYIAPSHRHKGVGTLLLEHLITESEKAGYWCLYVSIFSSNKQSIRLHEKCGFRLIGYREKIAKDIFGNWQDTTLMERRSKNI